MKMPFEMLDHLVSEMYLYPLDLEDGFSVEKHLAAIQLLVESNGWDIQEYLDEGWNLVWRERMAN